MVNATVQFVDGTGIRDMGRCLSVNAGRQLCCGQTLSIISTTSRPISSSSGGAGGSISTRRMVDVGSCVVVVPEDRLLVAARPAGR